MWHRTTMQGCCTLEGIQYSTWFHSAESGWAEWGSRTFVIATALYPRVGEHRFPNPDYRSEKLKDRLQIHEIHSLIAFANLNPGNKGCITFNLVYNASLSVADAVTYAYKLGSKDKYEDVALLLRGLIWQASCESQPLSWPPATEDLEVHSLNDVLPTDLIKFLSAAITGDTDMNRCEKTRLSNVQSQQFVTSAIPSLQQIETTSSAWRLEPLCPLKSSWMCYVLRLPVVTASLTVPLKTCSLNPSRSLSWKQWTPATKWSS